jgi:hypothetical protein
MAFLDVLLGVLLYGLALLGAILGVMNVMLFAKLKGFYTIPIRIMFSGGRMVLHTRGNYMIPIHIPKNYSKFEMEDANKTKRTFDILSDSYKLLCGMDTALSVDALPRTFSAADIMPLADQMTNAHFINLNRFSVPLKDAEGNMLYREIPLYDENTMQPLMEEVTVKETGKDGVETSKVVQRQMTRKIPMRQYYPIDERMPGYKTPEFFGGKEVGQRI